VTVHLGDVRRRRPRVYATAESRRRFPGDGPRWRAGHRVFFLGVRTMDRNSAARLTIPMTRHLDRAWCPLHSRWSAVVARAVFRRSSSALREFGYPLASRTRCSAAVQWRFARSGVNMSCPVRGLPHRRPQDQFISGVFLVFGEHVPAAALRLSTVVLLPVPLALLQFPPRPSSPSSVPVLSERHMSSSKIPWSVRFRASVRTHDGHAIWCIVASAWHLQCQGT
jgi:hypothetical protein